MKKEEKLKATDSNPYTAIRIPHEEHEERTEVKIQIPYTTIQIPDSAEALNAQPATPSTRFSSLISLTTAS